MKLLQFRVSEENYKKIRAKMASMQIRNMSAYLRKMAVDGFCVHLDISMIRELTTLLRRCSNNLNQYARKANQSGSIYREDIEDIKALLEEIYEEEKRILKDLQYLER